MKHTCPICRDYTTPDNLGGDNEYLEYIAHLLEHVAKGQGRLRKNQTGHDE